MAACAHSHEREFLIICTCSSVFQLYSVSAQRGAHCRWRKKERTRYTPLGPRLALKESLPLAFFLCYCISNKSVRCNPNLERKISLWIPKALAASRKTQQLKFSWVFDCKPSFQERQDLLLLTAVSYFPAWAKEEIRNPNRTRITETCPDCLWFKLPEQSRDS